MVYRDEETTSAEDFEAIVSELEDEHCNQDETKEKAIAVPGEPYVRESVLELDRIQKGKHEAIFKGSGPITQLGIVLGDDYKSFDIGAPHIIAVTINPQQMTIDEVQTDDEDQMSIDDVEPPVPVEDE